jgi:HEAT repeat protein
MTEQFELFSCRHAGLLILLLLFSGICAGCLGQDPLEAKVEKLIQSLGDEDENVSYASAYALVDIGESAIDPLIKALKDDDPQVRSLAARVLGEIGDQKAADSLIEVLDDPFPEVRMNAASSLGWLGASEAVEPLIELLKDENEGVVLSAVCALGALKDPRAVEPLCEALNSDDYTMHNSDDYTMHIDVILALEEIGDPRAVDPLLDLLDDKDVGSRAANALGHFESEEVFGKLTKFLRSSNPTTRANAVKVCYGLQDPASIPYLIEMLDDKAPEVRKEAAYVLIYFIEPEEVAQTELPLINALGDGDPEVQEVAARSLGRIESKDSIPYLEELLQAKNRNVQIAAVAALGNIGDTEAVDSLTALLGDDSWLLRKSIVDSLVKIGDSQAVDPLISLLGDENYRVRQGAANGLGKLGDQRAVEPLLKALETERERDVRNAEVWALGELGGPEAIEGLRRISTDMEEYRYVRAAAEEALKKIEGGEAANVYSTS